MSTYDESCLGKMFYYYRLMKNLFSELIFSSSIPCMFLLNYTFIKKVLFFKTVHPNSKRGTCFPLPLRELTTIHNISSCCKVNITIMSIFLPLNHFYLPKKSYCKLIIYVIICQFSLKFSCFMK